MSIKHFSLSALADLMIEEEPDDSHQKEEVSMTSPQTQQHSYSMDYDNEGFEQESTGSDSPALHSLDSHGGNEEEELTKKGAIKDNKVNEVIGESILTVESGGILNGSDSQNDNSSRTLYEMPVNKFSISPIGLVRDYTSIKNINNDVNDDHRHHRQVSNVNVALQETLEDSGNDIDLSFDNGQTHSILQSSPSPNQREKEQARDGRDSPVLHHATPKCTPHESSPKLTENGIKSEMHVRSKPSHGQKCRGFSTVNRLNIVDIQRACPNSRILSSKIRKSKLSTGKDETSSSPKILNNGNHNINFEDMKLMREVRKVLNKIEQCDGVSEEIKKIMPRKSVPVPGVKLGSGQALQEGVNKRRGQIISEVVPDIELSPSSSHHSDLMKMNLYEDFDSKGVNFSDLSIPSLQDKPQQRQQSLNRNSFDSRDSNSDHPHAIDVKANNLHFNLLSRATPPLPPDQYFTLSNLAEETYASFLSDIIEIARSRASSSKLKSIEEYAMHRCLSEFLFETFAKPTTVESIRKKMIHAAAESRRPWNPIAEKKLSGNGMQ